MGYCPIPSECDSVGACYEAQRVEERERAAQAERDFYEAQEAAYHADLERAHDAEMEARYRARRPARDLS